MSDQQIAERVGLTLNRTLIRNLRSGRRFDRAPFHRLNDLGGGRRFRAERYRDPRTLPAYAEEAQMLREAMQYNPELVERHVQAGWWRNETLRSWLMRSAMRTPTSSPSAVTVRRPVTGSFVRRLRRLQDI